MTALRRVLFSGAATALVALAVAAGPEPVHAQACYDCGSYKGPECTAITACAYVKWARICTKIILRYPSDDGPSIVNGPWLESG